MHIDYADAAEIPQLIPIFLELERYYFGKEAATEVELEDYLKKRVFGPRSGVEMVVASENETVLGFATFTLMYPAPKLSGQAYMKDLFVSTSARGLGVGKRLMQWLAQEVVSLGCQRLDWTAESSNPSAGAFYDAIGARRIKEKEYFRFEGEALLQFLES